MPIKFRCPHCRQFLGISRTHAGSVQDCPTCGRSIRVPQLDGQVEPVPAPQLDLADREIADVLANVAAIGSGPPQSAPSEVSLAEPGFSFLDVDPPRPIELAPDPIVQRQPAADPPMSAAAMREQLAELAVPLPTQRRSRPSSSDEGWTGMVLILLGFVCLATGAGLTYLLTPRGSAPVSAATHSEGAGAAVVQNQAAKPAGLVQIAGQIRSRDGAGGLRPDRGARILVLPVLRVGTARLSPAGLQMGANDIDQQLLRTSVGVLRGGFAVADDQGRFQFGLPASGRYSVLVISRYQSADGQTVSPLTESFLQRYFEPAAGVIGNLRYDFRELDLGESKSSLNVDFPTR